MEKQYLVGDLMYSNVKVKAEMLNLFITDLNNEKTFFFLNGHYQQTQKRVTLKLPFR